MTGLKNAGRLWVCLLFAGLLLFGAAAPVWAEDTRSLTAQITAIQKQIDAQAKHLDALKAQISDKNAELAKQQQAFSRARRGMSERVRAFYIFGNDGILQYLFTSDSIPEFLTKADQMRTVMSADNAQVAKVERLQRQIAREKAALEQEQRKAEQSQKQLNARLKTMQQKLMAYEKEHPDTSDNNSTSGVSPTTGHRTETSNQMDFICAVVAQECNSDYQGSLAVISCVMNRGDTGRWGGRNCVAVLKAPGQFSAYSSGAYKRYLHGRYPAHVKRAVEDCMLKGIRNHNYQSFHAGSSSPSFGGNHYY